jgi:hypothetical protein
MIQEIKGDMKAFYAFELTDEQIQEYLEKCYIDSFDTLERETYAGYLANKITGMEWPINMDSPEYKLKFYTALIKNSHKMGYKWHESS